LGLLLQTLFRPQLRRKEDVDENDCLVGGFVYSSRWVQFGQPGIHLLNLLIAFASVTLVVRSSLETLASMQATVSGARDLLQVIVLTVPLLTGRLRQCLFRLHDCASRKSDPFVVVVALSNETNELDVLRRTLTAARDASVPPH